MQADSKEMNSEGKKMKPESKEMQAGGKKRRLLSLDILRGITIVGMIIVNNAGGPKSYLYLQHSAWNGLTPCDLVFPFFLFIMGVTTWLSLSKYILKPTRQVICKILRRGFLILLIGWLIHWLENGIGGKGWLDFSHLRLTGILTRIALCYCIAGLMLVFFGFRKTIVTGAVLLVVYALLLLCCNGYENNLTNINAIIDRAILGADHLYTKKPIDPEGLAATLSAITHTIIGVWFGRIISARRPMNARLVKIFTIGFLMLLTGYLLSEMFPINKRIWSPTFVLVTCGMAASLLATLIFYVDEKGNSRWCRFFEIFGVNPLFLYVLSEVAAIFIKHWDIDLSVYSYLLHIIPNPEGASALYSILLMLLIGGIGYPLYRKKIYIKI